jgi:hypothetical protein
MEEIDHPDIGSVETIEKFLVSLRNVLDGYHEGDRLRKSVDIERRALANEIIALKERNSQLSASLIKMENDNKELAEAAKAKEDLELENKMLKEQLEAVRDPCREADDRIESRYKS